jgi:hypothetical protein
LKSVACLQWGGLFRERETDDDDKKEKKKKGKEPKMEENEKSV